MSSISEHLWDTVSHGDFHMSEVSEELQAKMRQFDGIVNHPKNNVNDDIQYLLTEGITYSEILTYLVTNHWGSVIEYLSWSREHGYHISASIGRESGLTYKQWWSYFNPDNTGIYPLNLEQVILIKYMENVLWKIILQDMYRRLSEISGKVTEIVAPKKMMMPERLSLEEAEELVLWIQSQIRSLLSVVDFAWFEKVEKNIKELLLDNWFKTSDIDVGLLETDGSFKIPEGATLQELLLVFGLHLACNPERITKANARRSLWYR